MRLVETKEGATPAAEDTAVARDSSVVVNWSLFVNKESCMFLRDSATLTIG
jgi:hypothetical protein